MWPAASSMIRTLPEGHEIDQSSVAGVTATTHCVFFVQYASNVIITVDLTGFSHMKSLLRQWIPGASVLNA